MWTNRTKKVARDRVKAEATGKHLAHVEASPSATGTTVRVSTTRVR